MTTTPDRARWSLIGPAAGDPVGTTVEFNPAVSFASHTGTVVGCRQCECGYSAERAVTRFEELQHGSSKANAFVRALPQTRAA